MCHLRKKEGSAIHRSLGSIGFMAAARAVWTVARDPDDPARRLFLPLKHNLAPDVTGLAFTIESSPENGPPCIRWCEQEIALSAESFVGRSRRPAGRPDIERQDAIEWLKKTLADGPRPVSEIKSEAAEFGFNIRTLRRAFQDLGGKAECVRLGMIAEWSWRIPEPSGQNPMAEIMSTSEFPTFSQTGVSQ